MGMAGWKTIRPARFVWEWKLNSTGEVNTTVSGAELYRDLMLPEVAEVDVAFRLRRGSGFAALGAKWRR